MRRILIPAVLALAAVGAAVRAAEEPGIGVEHDFGDAVVVFTLEYEDDLLPPAPWALTGASIRRLGDAFFLTGTEPPLEPGDEPAPARRHWIPLIDVVRMAEFGDVATARRAFEPEAGDDGHVARPTGRSVSRGRPLPAGDPRLNRTGGGLRYP